MDGLFLSFAARSTETVYLLRPRNEENWQGVFFLDGVKIVVQTRTRDFLAASSAARSAEERIRQRGLLDVFHAVGTA